MSLCLNTTTQIWTSRRIISRKSTSHHFHDSIKNEKDKKEKKEKT